MKIVHYNTNCKHNIFLNRSKQTFLLNAFLNRLHQWWCSFFLYHFFVCVLLFIFFSLLFIIFSIVLFFHRELQRIESITSAPILSHFIETIQGLTTIRAYNQESRFMEMLFKRMEANNVAFIILNTSNRWLGIALVITI